MIAFTVYCICKRRKKIDSVLWIGEHGIQNFEQRRGFLERASKKKRTPPSRRTKDVNSDPKIPKSRYAPQPHSHSAAISSLLPTKYSIHQHMHNKTLQPQIKETYRRRSHIRNRHSHILQSRFRRLDRSLSRLDRHPPNLRT